MTTTPTLEHSIDEALDRFTLVAGSGNWDDSQACAATLLAWAKGYEFTYHLECAHPILNSMAIEANDDDATTPNHRERIVRAGETGLLDTWWIPALVIFRAMADVDKDTSTVDRAVAILDAITWWKETRSPVSADLSSADLRSADLTSAYLSYACLLYTSPSPRD